MNASTDCSARKALAAFLPVSFLAVSLLLVPGSSEAGLLRGAFGGAVIGGIIGGDDGAAAGAIIGGIGGAANASRRRQEEMRRRDYYQRQQMERQMRQEDERLRLARERNQMLAAQQQPRRPAGMGSADAMLVRQTQSALTLLGWDIGAADGVLDDQTVMAIRSYQQSFGLMQTGNPSPELLQHMREHL